MHRKAWKIWTTALKNTFTTDRKNLHNLFMVPLRRGEPWMEHTLVGMNNTEGLIYDKKEMPSTPPKTAVKISLRSQTKYTYIFNNSDTEEVTIRHQEKGATK